MNLDYIIGNDATDNPGLVRSYIDEPSTTGVLSTDGSDWTQQELLSYVNAEHKHLFSAIRNLYEDWFMRTPVFALTSGQYRYDLPMDCVNPRRVEFLDPAGVSGTSPNYVVDETQADPEEVQEVEISGKDNLRHYTSSNRVVRTNGYYMFGDTIQFLPDSRVDRGYYYRLYYLPEAMDLHRAKVVASTNNTITLGVNAAAETLGFVSPIDNYYEGAYIEIIYGTGQGQIKRIASYDGATRIATISSNWRTNPDTTSIYSINSPIKSDFHELLALGAALRAKGIKTEDDSSAIGQMYSVVIADMIKSLERRNNQTPRRVMTTQRSGVWY